VTISYAVTRTTGAIPCATSGGAANFFAQAGFYYTDVIHDPNGSNNYTSAYSYSPPAPACPPADLSVSVSHSPSAFTSGSPTTYTITYTNSGPSSADGAAITDTMSTAIDSSQAENAYRQWSFISCTATAGAVCPTNFTSGQSSFYFGLGGLNDIVAPDTLFSTAIPILPPGGAITVVYQHTTDTTLYCATTLTATNNATISAPAGTADPVSNNNEVNDGFVTQTAACQTADLATTVAQPATGAPTTFSVSYANNGPAAADGSTIGVNLASSIFNPGSYPNGVAQYTITCSASAGAICPSDVSGNNGAYTRATADAGDFVATWPSGGILTLTYTVTVPCGVPAASLAIQSQTQLGSGGYDPNLTNNTATLQVATPSGVVCPQSDVAVSATSSGPFVPGQPVQLTYVFTNNGPGAADGGAINGALYTYGTFTSFDLSFVSCSASGGMTCPSGNKFTPEIISQSSAGQGVFYAPITRWPSGGTLTVVYQLMATVPMGLCPTASDLAIFNASATPPLGFTDTNPQNNAASNIEAITCANIAVNKAVVPNVANAGDAVAYTVDVSNAGPGDAQNVAFSDPLPTGFIYADASCAAQIGTPLCGPVNLDPTTQTVSSTIASLPNGTTARFTILGVANTTPGTYLNTAYAALPISYYNPIPASGNSFVSLQVNNTASSLTISEAVMGLPAAGLNSSLTFTGTLTCGSQAVQRWTVTIPAGAMSASITLTAWSGDSCEVSADADPAPPAGYTWSGMPTITPSTTTILDPSVQQTVTIGNTVAEATSPVLALTLNASASGFDVGQAASYTVQVTNQGAQATSAIATIVDTLPSGLTLGTLPDDCSAAGQTVSCTIASGLASGNSAQVTIPVFPQSILGGTLVTNTAAVNGGGDATCQSNPRCTSSVTTPVKAADQPQLTLRKTASAAQFIVGQAASYALQLTNTGTLATSAPALIVDSLPGSLTLGSLPHGCTANGQQVTCTAAAGLAPNASLRFTLPVALLPVAAGTTVTNTATVTGGGDPTCPGSANCSSTAAVTATLNTMPQLTVTGSLDTALIVGQPANYTWQITNTSTAVTTVPATLNDTIPAGLMLGILPANCSASGQQVSCTIAAGLAASGTASVVLPVTPEAVVNGMLVVNTAVISGGGDASCPAAKHCIATVSASPTMVQLTLTDTPNPVAFAVGEAAAYVLQATNTGAIASTEAATITDTVPSGLTLSTLPAACSANGQRVSCVIPSGLAPGTASSFSISVTPSTSLAGMTLTNTATLTGGGDFSCPTADHCTSTLTTTVNAPQLQLITTTSAGTFVVNQPASYVLQITNQGASATSAAITITDTVPADMAISQLPAGCNASGQLLRCTLAGLASGSSTNLTISVTPDGSLAGTSVTNTAIASGGGDASCPSTPRCSSTVTTDVLPAAQPQLTLTKTASAATFVVAQPATYTLLLTNTGTLTTNTAAQIVDTMPGNLTVGTLPADCVSHGLQVTCSVPSGLAPNAAASFIVPVTLLPVPSGTTLINTASVSGGGDLSCPGASHCIGSATVSAALNGVPQLTLVASADSASFVAGQGAIYRVQVTNTGTLATTATALLTDLLPANVALGTLPATCSATGQQIRCAINPGLAPGASLDFDLPITPALASAGTTLSNSAMISGGGDPGCPAASRCSDTLLTPVAPLAEYAPQLTLRMTLNPEPLVAGQTATYTLGVTNTGAIATSSSFSIIDVLPSNLAVAPQAVSPIAPKAETRAGLRSATSIATLPTGCTVSQKTITCTSAAVLEPGASVSFAIPVQVPIQGPTVLTNQATVSGGGDPTCPLAGHCISALTTAVVAPLGSLVPAPLDARWLLFALALGLLALGIWRLHASRMTGTYPISPRESTEWILSKARDEL
jgi:uncharacterized repeat protein (TIGR01451 family)